MKGLRVEMSPKARYSSTWDLRQVLDVISSWTPVKTLPLKLLTYKLVSLLALSTAARTQTLKALRVDKLYLTNDCVVFNCGDQLKNTKHGQDFLLELKKLIYVQLGL